MPEEVVRFDELPWVKETGLCWDWLQRNPDGKLQVKYLVDGGLRVNLVVPACRPLHNLVALFLDDRIVKDWQTNVEEMARDGHVAMNDYIRKVVQVLRGKFPEIPLSIDQFERSVLRYGATHLDDLLRT